MASGHVNREKQAEHMAAPHRFCDVKIFLANSEPSTHGPSLQFVALGTEVCNLRQTGHSPDGTRYRRARTAFTNAVTRSETSRAPMPGLFFSSRLVSALAISSNIAGR